MNDIKSCREDLTLALVSEYRKKAFNNLSDKVKGTLEGIEAAEKNLKRVFDGLSEMVKND